MSIGKHQEFLLYVKAYVSADPEVSAYIAEYVRQGISDALRDAKDRAFDLEIALSVSIDRRTSFNDPVEFIREKIEKWKGKLGLRWDWFLNNPKLPGIRRKQKPPVKKETAE